MKSNHRYMLVRCPWMLRMGISLLWMCCLLTPLVVCAQGAINFRVILVKEKKEAMQILKRIRAGAPFWKLAMDYSIYPNASLGGYVEAARPEELLEEYRSNLATLAPGEVSSPIPVPGGIAILKKEPGGTSKGVWKKAEKQFLEGVRRAAKGDFDGAQEEMRRVLLLYPNHQAAKFALQLIKAVQGKRVKRSIAQEVFEAAILVREGFPEKALVRLKRAARDAPKIPEIQVAMGEIYVARGQFSRAIPVYEKALASPAWSLMAHLSLGAAYLQLGDLSNALSHYQRVVAADIGLAPAHLGLGLVYLGMRKAEDAIKEIKVALAIDPQLDPAYNQLGLVLLSQGKVQEAIWAFEKALSIRPEHATYLSQLGFAYNQWGMFSKAVEILEQAISLAPNDPMIHNNLAIAYYDNGQMDKAVSHADRASSMGYQLHPDFLAKLAPYRKPQAKTSK